MLGPETGRVKEGCSVYIPIFLYPVGDVSGSVGAMPHD
jgi:hypothetical protein